MASEQNKDVNASVVGDLVSIAAKNPQLLATLVGLVTSLFGLFKKDKPPLQGEVPHLDDDDDIPPPPPAQKQKVVSGLRIKLGKVQYSRALFPDVYTEDNKFGLVDSERKSQIENGTANMSRESKFWVDATPIDQDGNEILAKDIAEGQPLAKLAFRPSFKLTASGSKTEVNGNGTPNPDMIQDSWIGAGITAYQSTKGFVAQFKCHGEGPVTVQVELEGAKSNVLKFNVS